MSELDTAANLVNQRLWYDLCIYIENNARKSPTQCYEILKQYVLPNFQRIHPVTFCDTVLLLANLMEPQKSYDLVKQSLELLSKLDVQTKHYNVIKLRYELKIFENLVYLKKTENVERFIYQSKNKIMEPEMYVYFYRLAYRYYEVIENYEECFVYLEKYVNLCHVVPDDSFTDSKELLAYKFVQFSVLSRKIYNFTGIRINNIYQHFKEQNMSIVFDKICAGDFNYILNNQDMVNNIFPGNFNLIKEKAFLVALSNICFDIRNKEIKIIEITEKLKVSRNTVFYFIVRAMGLELIKGTIDGQNDVLRLSYVKPRILTLDETKSLKDYIDSWRMRVKETIMLMS
ncbi:hypothetical protein EDEG_00093 [Edhazardia aedis USNM 41457]|uniref:PCI domain-containing protein n=1 Tax=Edhazardia aedis (strain USNM 41457) TaxID=1003232 RepID=J9DB35_EDHAE|nr:hypothetical protein EDEG_00093 [Edhazardia aedis USNM 41457]|eukprot:EJW04976.1 hypothetical protein EDEG_00093 [Edhazardia aedis USNM 41457]